MLPVHEDDQDLILGQAAPLSISTHTHTQPNLLLCTAAPPRRRRGAAAVYAAPTPSRRYRPPTAELVLLGRRCFAQRLQINAMFFKRIDKLCPFFVIQ